MSPRKKIYFWLIIFGGISLFFLVLVIPKFLGETRESSENFISLKNELASFRKEKESLSRLKVIYQNYQSNLAKIDEIFIDPEVPIEFINFLGKNAQLSQLKIEISLLPKREAEAETLPSLFFQVSTFGSFPNFLKFLEKLENAPYLIEVLDLNTRKSTEREIQSTKFQGLLPGDVESTFSIKAYTR